MIPCAHRLQVSGGWLCCRLEKGHGGPHEAPVDNSVGYELVSSSEGRNYPSSAVVVWHETKERS